MIVTTFAGDKPAGSQDPATARERGDAFQRTYARVFDERMTSQTSARPLDTPYSVRAGDTLSGIVRTRLATAGVTADTATLQRSVAQVARSNDIRNPDRIFAGQKLNLAALDAVTGGGDASKPIAATAARMTDVSRSDYALSKHETASVEQAEQDDMGPADAEQLAVVDPALLAPAVTAFASQEVSVASDSAAITPAAMRQIAVYEQRAADVPAKAAEPAGGLPDIVYKGIVGKVLDAIPMEASTRTALQRTNTVVSGALTVRSLGALAGVGGPLVAVAGLLWGIFSSRQINDAAAGDAKPAAGTNPVADAKQNAPTRVADAAN